MHPLRLALLWHQHQPDYRLDGAFVLPWVSLHAAKDYASLPLLFERFPKVRHTMNVVPSLMEQIDDAAKGMLDPVRALFRRESATYSNVDRSALADWLSTAQYATMVQPLPRFAALWPRLKNSHTLTDQECTDLKACFLLAWIGPQHRRLDTVARLLLKGALYSHDDVVTLLDMHSMLAAEVTPVLRRLQDAAILELSTTPYHHPILPLLISTDVGEQSDPRCPVPQPPVHRAADARLQVQMALDSHRERFGSSPAGVWPAEGAVSDEALALLASHNIQWAATDAEVLRRTLGEAWQPTMAFYPWEVDTGSGHVNMLFRDRELSDAIGFSYASWDPQAAARDFVSRLEERRRHIASVHGWESLRHAVVPVILDGENCWEFYPNNGQDFLEALLGQLSDSDNIVTVHCCDAAQSNHCVAGQALTTIHPGSWIDATFDVWIGTPAKNAAWAALRDVGDILDTYSGLGKVEALAEYLAAQASDVFWWYHDRHQAPHKSVFDELFRQRLQRVLKLMGQPQLPHLATSFHSAPLMSNDRTYPILFSGGATHAADVVTSDVCITTQDAWQRLVVSFRRWPAEGESVTLTVTDRHGQERSCLVTADGGVLWQSPLHDEGCARQELAIAIYVRAASQWKITVVEDVGPTRTAELDVAAPEV